MARPPFAVFNKPGLNGKSLYSARFSGSETGAIFRTITLEEGGKPVRNRFRTMRLAARKHQNGVGALEQVQDTIPWLGRQIGKAPLIGDWRLVIGLGATPVRSVARPGVGLSLQVLAGVVPTVCRLRTGWAPAVHRLGAGCAPAGRRLCTGWAPAVHRLRAFRSIPGPEAISCRIGASLVQFSRLVHINQAAGTALNQHGHDGVTAEVCGYTFAQLCSISKHAWRNVGILITVMIGWQHPGGRTHQPICSRRTPSGFERAAAPIRSA
jgi:hypothetical protein